MFGGEDDESKGIIPRALDELFIRISKDATGSNFEVTVLLLLPPPMVDSLIAFGDPLYTPLPAYA